MALFGASNRFSALPTGFPTGQRLLHDPAHNKGTAFSYEERVALGLRGLVPPGINTMEEQVSRVMGNYHRKENDLERYIFLVALQDRNQTLFYRVLSEHLEEMLPIIYTPTVGQACQRFVHIFRRPKGVFVSTNDKGHFSETLRNWPNRDVRVIVMTDGERILGLGDLGAAGMGIPAGKLSLYTACAGIHPNWCLPVTIDVGTNNADLLKDPLYFGMKHERLRGEAYDDLIEEFIMAVENNFPHTLIQFEDFGNTNAFRLLENYCERICTFNDDIQGTAAVALAGLYAALRVSNAKLVDQKILFLGAGEAGTGIGELIVAAMVDEGLSEAQARSRCWFVDSHGIIVKNRGKLAAHKKPFAHEHEHIPSFLEAVRVLKPTAIIGVCGKAHTFTREVVKTMATHNPRPIIFALSNPTANSECTAQQAYAWSNGRALFASGSPFDPVELNGRQFVPGQGNNVYIFPGVGLGAVACKARRITNDMFLTAAKTLAALVTPADLQQGSVYPSLQKIKEISKLIAMAVAEAAYEKKLAAASKPIDMKAFIQSHMWEPVYVDYV
jgi:malate dehydrogenase (oxaloacetate-decarboxylating)(NADP+)